MKLRELIAKAELLSKLVDCDVVIVPKDYKTNDQGFLVSCKKDWDGFQFNLEYWKDDLESEIGLIVPQDTTIWRLDCSYMGWSETIYIHLDSEDWIIHYGALNSIKYRLGEVQAAFDAVKDLELVEGGDNEAEKAVGD